MKKLFIILAMVSFLRAELPSDKIMHAGAGFIIYSACIVFDAVTDNEYLDPMTCLIPVGIAAVGKELYDSQHPENHTAEFGDALATMAIPLAFSFTIYKW